MRENTVSPPRVRRAVSVRAYAPPVRSAESIHSQIFATDEASCKIILERYEFGQGAFVAIEERSPRPVSSIIRLMSLSFPGTMRIFRTTGVSKGRFCLVSESSLSICTSSGLSCVASTIKPTDRLGFETTMRLPGRSYQI